MFGRTAADVHAAHSSGRTAIFYGLQNCSPMEDDIGLIEILHQLGVRFMQLSYNNQSLLATGCYEAEDPGLTRFGRQAIEMNRVGLVVDMVIHLKGPALKRLNVLPGQSPLPMPTQAGGTRPSETNHMS